MEVKDSLKLSLESFVRDAILYEKEKNFFRRPLLVCWHKMYGVKFYWHVEFDLMIGILNLPDSVWIEDSDTYHQNKCKRELN